MSLPTQVDDDLREVDFGQWEGKRFDEIAAGYPDEVKQWGEHFEDFTFPGGESVEAFMERVRRAADRAAQDPAETVLAVTHGGVIRHMICHFLGLEPWRYILFDVQCSTCATVKLFNGKGILTGLNERWLGEGG
jgi:broad specificity phosphatase PhoE